MSSDPVNNLSSDALEERLARDRQGHADAWNQLVGTIQRADESLTRHESAFRTRPGRSAPSPRDNQLRGSPVNTGNQDDFDFDTPMPAPDDDPMDDDDVDAAESSTARKHPRAPLGEGEIEPEGTPSKQSKPKPKGKAKGKVSQKTREAQWTRETDLSNNPLYLLDGNGMDPGQTSSNLAPLATQQDLLARVQTYWRNVLQANRRLSNFAGWVRNKTFGYCAAASAVSNTKSSRSRSQTEHQACDSCISQRRPCLVWIDNNIVLVPRAAISLDERFDYF